MNTDKTIEPLHIQNLSDYHCHCDYSIDATGSIDEYCEAAIRRGLAELCFTTHYDSNPQGSGKDNFMVVKGERIPTGFKPVRAYVEDICRASDRYYPMGLAVKPGIEFGWYPGCEEEARRLKQEFDFDYFLCGIHEIDNLCFCCHTEYEQCFARYDADTAVRAYIAEITAAAESGLFNAIAHLDYIRKYGTAYYGEVLDESLTAIMPEVFPVLAKHNVALEINTSGLRKGIGHYFPRIELINRARRAEVAVRYLGSDAHRPEDVGYDFDAAAALVSSSIVSCESC